MSHNQYSQIQEGLCNMDKLKVLLIHGNHIKGLPRDINRLLKIEEFGLEWW
jgi:Leucine-rich repeat (LRR) protein